MSFRGALLATTFAVVVAGTVSATPLNLSPTKPDIFSDAITVTYDSGSDSFSALGFAEELVNQALVHFPITGPQGFSITANIDGSGNAISGALSITGNIVGLGAGSPLLTGSLTAFGFPANADEPLEFLFQVTGGSLAVPTLYGTPGPGATVGVILSQTGSNFVDWGHSWDNFDNIVGAVSDSFAVSVPEPASASLIGFVLGLGLLGRRRSR